MSSFALALGIALFQDDGGGGVIAALGGLIGSLCGLVFAVVVIAGMWKVFTKAGQPGWAAIIPIYNLYIITQIVGRPVWWVVLFFVPFVNFIALIITMNDLSKSYGQGMGFTIGLILLSPIFIPILGFGPSTYVGPSAPADGGLM